MSFDVIRESLSKALSGVECHPLWESILTDTVPGHYGLFDLLVEVMPEDLWMDIPNMTFTFNNGALNFVARLYASSDKDGCDRSISTTVSGNGHFSWIPMGKGRVEIDDFDINELANLFPT